MIELLLLDGSPLTVPLAHPQRILSPEELKYYATFCADSRRCEFLLGRLLLKAALSARTGHHIYDLSLIGTGISATGKPFVAGAEFSLSHDGDAVLLAVGDQPVGVDIETVQHFDDAMMSMCFDTSERQRIVRSRRPDHVATLLWCVKEAVAKATGNGLLPKLAGKTTGAKQFVRAGFLRLAECERAYAVCSPLPIPPIQIMPARPRFDEIILRYASPVHPNAVVTMVCASAMTSSRCAVPLKLSA